MKDLSEYCECSFIDGTNLKVNEVSKINFGVVSQAVLSTENLTIKNEKKIEKSYLHLKNKNVIIRIGGTNIVEREEVYRRVEDAINSLGNAIEYGICLRCWSNLHQYV